MPSRDLSWSRYVSARGLSKVLHPLPENLHHHCRITIVVEPLHPVGPSVTFTVTVTSADSTLTVAHHVLTDVHDQHGSRHLTPNSSGIATYSTSTLAVGNHSITATLCR